MEKERGEQRKTTFRDLYSLARRVDVEVDSYVKSLELNPKPKPENATDNYIVGLAAYGNMLESSLTKSAELESKMDHMALAKFQRDAQELKTRFEEHIKSISDEEYNALLEKSDGAEKDGRVVLLNQLDIFSREEKQTIYYKLVIDAAADELVNVEVSLKEIHRVRSLNQFKTGK